MGWVLRVALSIPLAGLACHRSSTTDASPGSAVDTGPNTPSVPVDCPDVPSPDSDGDGVSDDAEITLSMTDPATFDGGCLPWDSHFEDADGGVFGAEFVLGDVDDDGDLDAVAGDTGTTLFWYQNTGGSFSNARELLTMEAWNSTYEDWEVVRAYGIVVADLEQDGVPDVIFTGDGIWELSGNGSGTFEPPVQLTDARTYARISAMDLDGDGDTDLVTGNSLGELAWFENFGGGSFVEHPINQRYWERVSPSDLDGDGDVDLVFTLGFLNGDVGWYENLGGATRWATHTLGRYGEVNHLAVGDFDGDGDDDVAATGPVAIAEGLRLWENLGGGAFSATVVASPWALVAAADLDGDADDDLVGGEQDGPLSWFVSQGGLLTALPIADDLPLHLQVGDLDGDGAPDVAAGPGFVWYTNPLAGDDDLDGLSNDIEVCVLHTRRDAADSDGDGFDDGVEVCNLSDPNDPASHP